jgi:predicted transcriptional regulator
MSFSFRVKKRNLSVTKKGYDFLMEIRRLKKMSEAFGVPV